MAMTSKSPMTQTESSVVCMPNKFFIIPKKSTGTFVLFNTIKTHDFFRNMCIEEGLNKLINDAQSEGELEDNLNDLLENDSQYIHDLNVATKKSIKGFLGKKTLMVKNGKSWTSFSPKGKAATRLLVNFYQF